MLSLPKHCSIFSRVVIISKILLPQHNALYNPANKFLAGTNMRSGIFLGITVVLVVLQGCGRKGPLTLPASQAQAPLPQAIQIQTPGPQTPDPQKSGAPNSLQGNKP